MIEEVMGAEHCFYCGQITDAHPPTDIPAELADLPEWRCYSCFVMMPGWRLHCSQCGGSHGNAQAPQYAQLYSSTGLSCSCAPAQPSGSDGLQNLNHTLVGFVVLLITILIAGVLQTEGLAARDDMISSVVMYAIILGYGIANWRLILPLFRLPAGSWKLLLLSIVAAPITVVLAHMQLVVFPTLEKYWLNYSTSYLEEGYGWGVALVSIAVGPAIFEEMFFRGVMLHRLVRVMTDWQAIIVTAMAFAILHLAAIGLVFYLVPMAIIAGWLTIRSKSLWPAMLFHFLHNSSIVYLEYIGMQ